MEQRSQRIISFFEQELKSLHSEVEQLEKLHEEIVQGQTKESKKLLETYEKRAKELKERLEQYAKRAKKLKEENKTLTEKYNRVKKKAELYAKENEYRRNDLKGLSTLNESSLAKDSSVLQELHRRLAEKDKLLQDYKEMLEKLKLERSMLDTKSIKDEITKTAKLEEETRRLLFESDKKL